jgi:hypothetical protein
VLKSNAHFKVFRGWKFKQIVFWGGTFGIWLELNKTIKIWPPLLNTGVCIRRGKRSIHTHTSMYPLPHWFPIPPWDTPARHSMRCSHRSWSRMKSQASFFNKAPQPLLFCYSNQNQINTEAFQATYCLPWSETEKWQNYYYFLKTLFRMSCHI